MHHGFRGNELRRPLFPEQHLRHPREISVPYCGVQAGVIALRVRDVDRQKLALHICVSHHMPLQLLRINERLAILDARLGTVAHVPTIGTGLSFRLQILKTRLSALKLTG
ncbi:MAG: hypothetical protein ABL878_20030 [Burkholderiales bacterium]